MKNESLHGFFVRMLTTKGTLYWRSVKIMIYPPFPNAFPVVFGWTCCTSFWSASWFKLFETDLAIGFLLGFFWFTFFSLEVDYRQLRNGLNKLLWWWLRIELPYISNCLLSIGTYDCFWSSTHSLQCYRWYFFFLQLIHFLHNVRDFRSWEGVPLWTFLCRRKVAFNLKRWLHMAYWHWKGYNYSIRRAP